MFNMAATLLPAAPGRQRPSSPAPRTRDSAPHEAGSPQLAPRGPAGLTQGSPTAPGAPHPPAPAHAVPAASGAALGVPASELPLAEALRRVPGYVADVRRVGHGMAASVDAALEDILQHTARAYWLPGARRRRLDAVVDAREAIVRDCLSQLAADLDALCDRALEMYPQLTRKPVAEQVDSDVGQVLRASGLYSRALAREPALLSRFRTFRWTQSIKVEEGGMMRPYLA